MAVYAKIENNELITAHNGYNDITGLADSAELCIENGFTLYTELEVTGYHFKTHAIIDGILTDISNTPEYLQQQVDKRNAEFENNFFEISGYGWYRKQPKGYSSAIESLNTLCNAVTVLGMLPKDYITFYTKPDFSDAAQCTEGWLVENSSKNNEMSVQQFGLFYKTAITIWNSQEH